MKDNYGYSLARQNGNNPKEEDYFFESGGEKVVGLEEKEDADGTRHVILYLSNDHYLEFTGSNRLEQAKYCFKSRTYRLKYEGYIKRQLKQVEEARKMEERRLPADLDYGAIPGLRLEAREKLQRIRPASFGQAGRISGVSPADLSVLMIYMSLRDKE